MQILTFNLLMYTVSGIWRPVEWSSNWAKWLYNALTCLMLASLYGFALFSIMHIIFLADNIDEIFTTSFLIIGMMAVCCKATLVTTRRRKIINLLQVLSKEPCRPKDKDEISIQVKFNDFIQSCTIKYLLLALSSVTSVTFRSIVTMMQGELPYRMWLPYDSNISLLFWVTSMQQIIVIFFSTIINVGTETLVFGLILQTCAQFDIFESRLHKLITNKENTSLNKRKILISEYVHHHLIIYKYAETTNEIFNQALFVQFFGSIMILCTCVYYMSTHITETASLLMYIICMIIQIYLYCWSGNEVMLKSMNVGDAVYNNVDWPLLSVSEKRDLLMIMMRSTIPIRFTSSFLITLSLQSYSNILKASYSVFNMLQRY